MKIGKKFGHKKEKQCKNVNKSHKGIYVLYKREGNQEIST